MNLLDIQKNRIDNEIIEIREKRNIWLTAGLTVPPSIFIGLAIVNGKPSFVGLLSALIAAGGFNWMYNRYQEKLELKMDELRELEGKISKKKTTGKKFEGKEDIKSKLEKFYRKYIYQPS